MRFGKQGPHLALSFFEKGGQLAGATLSLSDTFRCEGGNAALWEWLELYAQKKAPVATWVLDLLQGTDFQRRVAKELVAVPFGQTISYQGLARKCDSPRGARAIGNACNKNPFPLLIPCHRVIQSDGTLGGFAVSYEIKRRLLAFESSLPEK